MAVEQLIKKGDDKLADKDFLGAISAFSKAVEENPKAFQALLKRSIAYQRLKNYDAAKRDVSEAFTIAESRGKREEIAQCYYRLGMTYYGEKSYRLALKNLQKAKEHNSKEAALDTWIIKCERDVKNHPEEDSDEELGLTEDTTPAPEAPAATPASTKSTSVDVINKHAPLKTKIREDWYQSNDEVIITIYAKGIKEADFSIKFTDNSVQVSFPNGANSEYNYNLEPLYAKIDPEASSHKIYSTKAEVVLKKVEKFKWATLEKSGVDEDVVHRSADSEAASSLVYPSSSKKKINWANFKVEDDEEEDSGEKDFFAKLYGDADENTKRAMMKSYVESNGTVLTTNWDEAKDKQFETSPPDGMQARKWN